MKDLIDREAALNCFHDWVDQYGDVYTPDEMPEYRAIEALPSVQPNGPDNLVKDSQCLAKDLVNDTISRRAAIEAIEKHIRTAEEPYQLTDTDKILNHAFEIAASCIYNLPSAQPYTDEEIQKMQDIEQAQLDKAYEMGKADALRWIPWNSGRFPKESGTYTVTAYDGATKRSTYAKYQKRLKRWELTGARAYWRVLAWMPLPEPYKGDEK